MSWLDSILPADAKSELLSWLNSGADVNTRLRYLDAKNRLEPGAPLARNAPSVVRSELLRGGIGPEAQQRFWESDAAQTAAGFLGPMGGMGFGGVMTYHGTPHTWTPEPGFPRGRFRLDKMGTGEGAQAYGKGAYLPESRGVGEGYRDRLSAGKRFTVEVNGTMKDVRDTTGAENIALASIIQSPNKSVDEIIKSYREGAANTPWAKEWHAAADYLEKNKKSIRRLPEPVIGKGNLYPQDLPDEVLPRMLQWDVPLSQQSEIVRSSPSIARLIAEDAAYADRYPHSPFGGERLGKNVLTTVPESQLHAEGIPGLSFYDAGSRAAGAGTRNHVIWDQDLLDLMARQ